ncbi:tetratricopeptide repeat protein [Clostridium sp. MSJ-4]|uniref:Tetratricopeptide repeat protein n=1 Tax=Clostridium simiarum TaxID=2841506 RepID=A0ABS6EW18_9CLOT|nr:MULTISPECIES: tetratricopeptide repeat protein [Clostridium]MBU5590406.1 tetratricopeptide repeat protein [Clostridium simiarum]
MNTEDKLKEFRSYGSPFYLKEPTLNKKKHIASLLIILLFSIANPLFFISFIAYLIFLLYKIKQYNSEENTGLSKAISLYKKKKYIESIDYIDKVIEKKPEDIKSNIIKALNHFELGQYEYYIMHIEKVPSKYLSNDLDLQLKLGESYESINQYEEAKIIYKKLYDIFPESSYLKEKIYKLSR